MYCTHPNYYVDIRHFCSDPGQRLCERMGTHLLTNEKNVRLNACNGVVDTATEDR